MPPQKKIADYTAINMYTAAAMIMHSAKRFGFTERYIGRLDANNGGGDSGDILVMFNAAHCNIRSPCIARAAHANMLKEDQINLATLSNFLYIIPNSRQLAVQKGLNRHTFLLESIHCP